MPPVSVYRFGSFRLDPTRRRLLSPSGIVPLPERVFQLLLALVEAGGEVVDKDTLVSRLWPNQTVADGNLTQHVYLLRQLLGERARDHSYVMTLPGKGYWLGTPVIDARALKHTLPPDRSILSGEAESFEDSPQFRLYCVGSRLLEARTVPSLKKAIDRFEAALATDADYVPALVGLARSYALLAEFWHVPPQQPFARAKSAVLRALELDPNSALAHAVLSEVLMFGEWDWQGAERELLAARRGLASSAIRTNAAWFYVCQGVHDRAIYEAQRAIALEPASPSLHLLMARTFVHAGRFDDGIAYLTNLLDVDETFYIVRRYRAQAYLLQGEPQRALSDLLLLPQERTEEPSFRLPMLSRAYAALGDVPRARQVQGGLLDLGKTDYVPLWNVAITQYGLGDVDAALKTLGDAVEQREPTVLFLRSLHWFKELEDTPEFKALLTNVGP